MKNIQLLPFERNRYYPGKMLTSADFEAEQSYMNNKRRFINNALFGSGIVCGLNVFSLDDLSILVESGVAIDDFGREIVVESSVVKKLSALPGFEDTSSEHVLLSLRYAEEPVHAVYSLSESAEGKKYECNRIQESFELFLMDAGDMTDDFLVDEEFFQKTSLYEGRDYSASACFVTTAPAGHWTKLTVSVEKLTDESHAFSLMTQIQAPSFLTTDGRHELTVDVPTINMRKGERRNFDYYLKASETARKDYEIVIGDVSVYIDDNEETRKAGVPMTVAVEEIDPDDLVTRGLGKLSYEMRKVATRREYIPLARLKLTKTDAAYLIDGIEEQGVKQYITTPSAQDKRREYRAFFVDEPINGTLAAVGESRVDVGRASVDNSRMQMASGTVEIALGDRARRGDVCYSAEVMHGLGRGTVYVEVGFEYYAEDPVLKADTRTTVYGDANLFRKEGADIPEVDTAVKVLNDKGTFVVAVKLLKDVSYQVLNFRWVAVRIPGSDELGLTEDITNQSITAVTPTVVLATRDSYFFDVAFHNMDRTSVAYEMTEPNSGEVTEDGVYTAPSREGVYEIRIYCVDYPMIYTYAYAIVKKKGTEAE